MVGLLLCVLGTIPYETAVRDHVDLIEVNSLYDDNGRYVFTQVLFRNYDDRLNKFVVEDWRLPKRVSNTPAQGVFIFHDEQDRVLRRVTCDEVRETWTQYDPEVQEREILPKEMRRGLSKPLLKPPRVKTP